MPMRITRSLLTFVFGLTALSGCGGGAESDGDPLVSWTVRATAGTGGSISPSSQTVGDGESVTLTVAPDDGFGVDQVTGCGGVFDAASNTYTISEVKYTCLVSASFTPTSYDVTTAVGPDGTISPESVSLDYGGKATFTLSPSEGYGIASVTGCGGKLAGAIYTTGEVTADCTVEASFAPGYTIGGDLELLPAENVSIVLQNNGGDDLTLSASGPFTFELPIVDGGDYAVTIAKQPGGQRCSISSGTGSVAGAAVTSVQVGNCYYVAPAAPEVTLTYGIKELQFSWAPVEGATHYRLLENPDGVSGYAQVGADLTTTGLKHRIALYRRVNARYQVEACNDAGCTGSDEIVLADYLLPAIGYFKADAPVTGDYFGSAVALSADGGTLAVGASQEESKSGAVYVFVRSEAGWSLQARLQGAAMASNSQFGNAVALSADGNTLAVGAYRDGDQAGGRVYVFSRPEGGSEWTQDKVLMADDESRRDDRFGTTVSLSADGNTLAVGADEADGVDPATEDPLTNSGAAYIFTRTDAAAAWSAPQKIEAADFDAYHHFGWSVALSGDGLTLVVGAYRADADSLDNSGAAYVFVPDPDAGGWVQQARLKAPNAGKDDYFGTAVAVSQDGNTVAVGAAEEDSAATGIDGSSNDDATDAGAAYVFTRSGGLWSTDPVYIKPLVMTAGDRFGASIALDGTGTTLAVGAHREKSAATGVEGDQNSTGAINSGAVYLFSLGTGGWYQKAYVKAPNTDEGDRFGGPVILDSTGGLAFAGGLALSADGDTLAVPAHREDSSATQVDGEQADNSVIDSGAVYLY